MTTKQAREAEIDERARQRLAAEEANARRLAPHTLGMAWRGFWKHPSPWLIISTLTAAWAARVYVGGWGLGDLLVPVVLVATFPVLEWLIHVFVLHWKPREIGPVTLDTLLARDHRRHHADPRDIPLVFIPWRTYFWLIPLLFLIGLVVYPAAGTDLGTGLSYVVSMTTLGILYEWTHYLIHSDYKPKTRVYKAIWRNHRLHHYKNERYWFSVTSSGTSDRLFGTYPDPATVPTSPTAKNLHGAA